MLLVLALIVVGTIIGIAALNMSTQKVKTSTDYASCQQALRTADGGIDRVMNDLIRTPDTDADGQFDTTPDPAKNDDYGVPIFDIDEDGNTDFYQIFVLKKNLPDKTTVSRSSATKITLAAGKDNMAYVWIESQKPSSDQATIHSSATVGRCTKTAHAIIENIPGASAPGGSYQITSAIEHLPP